MQKMIWFSCGSSSFLSRVYNTSLKIKRSEMNSIPLKTLAKPYNTPLEIKKKG
jgi:hypothetical protein